MPQTTMQKTECVNPNTGRRMKISTEVYDLFSKAIYHTLKSAPPLTFTQLAEGVHECLHLKKETFAGSIPWYTITVKYDMEVKGIIETFTMKGKKLHRLKK